MIVLRPVVAELLAERYGSTQRDLPRVNRDTPAVFEHRRRVLGEALGGLPFICEYCRLGEHGACTGGTWCDCQHRAKAGETIP